jgi:hypothetical protein
MPIMDLEFDIEHKKMELIKWLSSINDDKVIEKLINLRKKEDKDWWNIISKEERQLVDKGLDEAQKGKLNSHNEVKKLYEKWL